jgi:hypothetical protein
MMSDSELAIMNAQVEDIFAKGCFQCGDKATVLAGCRNIRLDVVYVSAACDSCAKTLQFLYREGEFERLRDCGDPDIRIIELIARRENGRWTSVPDYRTWHHIPLSLFD